MLKDKSPDKIIQQQGSQTESISMTQHAVRKKSLTELYIRPIMSKQNSKGEKEIETNCIWKHSQMFLSHERTV